MKFIIKHESKGRIRIHAVQYRMTYVQADTLLYYLHSQKEITFAKVYDRTCDATISYAGDRERIIELLRNFHYERAEVPTGLIETSGRELNNSYQEKLIGQIVFHYARRIILPYPIRVCLTMLRSVRYLWKGLKTLAAGKIEVPVLDATAIGVSLLRNDFNTAGSIMFMLGIGELLEEWTHKKSVDDLARTMSLNVSKVWMVSDGQEVLVPTTQIKAGDEIVVHMGNIIPFDGVVTKGEAMVNQASLTGESVPIRKTLESTAYAGTVVEEGELTILVKEVGGSSRFEKIVTMIEESEKLKSGVESKAEHLADKLVPYSLGGTILTYLLTRNATKALSILMVDYSCALKLAMPISVLSAIREASLYNVTVKGGKYLEAIAEADTIVFDKTGTLTKGVFEVSAVHHSPMEQEKLLEYAALAECASSHPISKSLQKAYGKAIDRSRVTGIEEISGHGITATVDGHAVAAGNSKLMAKLGVEYHDCHCVGTIIHMAVDGQYAGHIVISDVVKPHSKEAIAQLKKAGVAKTVMLTGDAKRVAESVAAELGVDEVRSELLPADKVAQVEKLLAAKGKHEQLAFVGDGINDAPVLTRADIGIAMGAMGSDAAIEAADVVLMDDDPLQIAKAIKISRKCIGIVKQNIVFSLIVKFGCLALVALGIANMWAAIFADVGVMVLAVLNAIRALKYKD